MKRAKRIFLAGVFILISAACTFAQKKDTLRVLEKDQEYFKQGNKLVDSSKFKEAIKLFQKAIKENPVFFQAYNRMAFCKVQLKDLEGAEKDLEKSLKIQPDDQGTMKYLGYVYMEDKKYPMAKIYLDSAVKINKDDYELDYFAGCLKLIGKDMKGALASFNHAIELRENFGPAYLKRGLIFFQQKNFKFAIRDLTRGLELSPADSSNLEVFRARADACFEMGDYNGSVRDYSRIITVDPRNEDAYIFRGAAKIEMKDFSGAIDDESSAIGLNKNSFIAYNFRGVAKGGLKTYGEAIKDFDLSIKIRSNYASAYVNRASVKYAMGEKRKACDDLYKADQMGSNIAYKYIEAYCKGLEGQK